MTDQKKKKNEIIKARRTMYTVMFIGWFFVSFVWMWIALNNYMPPYYRPQLRHVIDYAQLLEIHRNDIPFVLFQPRWFLSIQAIIALYLLIKARSIIPILAMLVPVICGGCLIIWTWVMQSYTYLTHITTTEFDNKIYHLTYLEGVFVDLGAMDEYDLLLFECELDENTCRGRKLVNVWDIDKLSWRDERTPADLFRNAEYPFDSLALRVDVERNQLIVQTDEEEIFALDAATKPSSIPMHLEPISMENVSELVELDRIYGASEVRELAWSHDGAYLVAGEFYHLWVYHLAADSISTDVIPYHYYDLAFILNDHLLQIKGIDWKDIWDTEALTPIYVNEQQLNSVHNSFAALFTLPEFTEARRVHTIVVSPDDQFVALNRDVDYTDFVTVWRRDDSAPDGLVLVLDMNDVGHISFLSFSPDSSHILFHSWRYDDERQRTSWLRIWDVNATAELVITLQNNSVNTVQWLSQDTIALIYNNQQVELRNTSTGAVTNTYTLAIRPVEVAWTPTRDLMLATERDHPNNWLHFIDPFNGEIQHTLQPAYSGIFAVSADGRLLAIGNSDRTMSIWGIPSEEE